MVGLVVFYVKYILIIIMKECNNVIINGIFFLHDQGGGVGGGSVCILC